jgi:hypothetical protein
MARDNGEAGAEGQRPDKAFPKGFKKVLRSPFVEAFVGLTGPYKSGARIRFSTGFDAISSSASN